MGVAEKDIKLLLGLAAARCSAPGCQKDLAPLLAKSGKIVLGEMAHVIGRRHGAARSNLDVGANDTYDNLILLCPTHHTLVDKAEGDHPAELLRCWKRYWEAEVAERLRPIVSADFGDPLEMRFWTVFKFDLILDLYKQRFPSLSIENSMGELIKVGVIADNGFPREGPEEVYRPSAFDGWPQHMAMELRLRYARLFEKIIYDRPPLDLDAFWGVRKLQSLLYPTAIVFLNRLCTFKTVRTAGFREERTVTCRAQKVEIVFQIDTWNVYSSSAFSSHFRGRKQVSAVLLIRSVTPTVGAGKIRLTIAATPITMGSSFRSPHDRKPKIAHQREAIEDGFGDADDDPNTD